MSAIYANQSNSLKRAHQQLGIVDVQVYFPKYYVDQNELEQHDKAEKGKYTIGLGQQKMAFVKDNEDINSITLSVVDKLIRRNNIAYKDISRLEVGTETFLDKSKSIKTHLMELFRESGNFDVEGITTTNACYGGTNALINALNWMYSDFYDGKYAIVVCADIAVYSKGRARPTGGCGSIAILLGPSASIQVEHTRASYMNNVYDFYKPNPTSEYPEVDGVFSIDCYFKALEYCWSKYLEKENTKSDKNFGTSLNDFDYFCFHSPFAKMVEKAFFQLLSYDLSLNNARVSEVLSNASNYLGLNLEKEENKKALASLLETFKNRKHDFKLDNKLLGEIKKIFQSTFKSLVEPSLFMGKNLGNIYTGSLYLGLMSLILNDKIDLTNKRVMMFSYGSGCAATIYTLKFSPANLGDYKDIRKRNSDVLSNLNGRMKMPPTSYEVILAKKEKLFLSNDYAPESNSNLEELFDGAFYIEKVDKMWRRHYSQKDSANTNAKKTLSYNKLSNGLNRVAMIRNQLMGSN